MSNLYHSSKRFTNNIRSEIPSKAYDEYVNKYFQKKFEFKKNPSWMLPPVEDIFKENACDASVHPQLKSVKDELNSAKNKLNNYSLEVWSKHTQKRDPAGGIGWSLRREINAEFVTKAWCKFFEILNTYPIVRVTDQSTGLFNSVHLCEAPGAFVASLNHYLKLNFNKVKCSLKWDWCATTLNPYYEGNTLNSTVLDDRLILHTFDHWEFGDDYTGDITKIQTLVALERRAQRMGKINLVTADGSVDCMEAPQDQEEIVTFLHFAEIVAALRILDNGGCFVLKMFTFFETQTINLLYLLCNCFENVHVFKPVTSKQGNSEVYVISMGFSKSTILNSYLELMTLNLTQHSSSKLLFSSGAIPVDFIEQIIKCSQCFMEHQVDAIETNIKNFRRRDPADPIENIQDLRYALKRAYFRNYAVDSIPEQHRLIYSQSAALPQNMNVPVYSYGGSYAERKIFMELSEERKIEVLRNDLMALQKDSVFLCRIKSTSLKMQKFKDDEEFLDIFYGQPIQCVVSSKFMLVQFMKLLLEIVQNSKISCNAALMTTTTVNETTVITINIKAYKLIRDFNAFERELFNKIIGLIIDGCTPTIRIENYLLLTHFSVGLFYALGQRVFEEVCLTYNGHIILQSPRPNACDYVNRILLPKLQNLARNDLSVLNIVNIGYLRYEDFYNSVLSYNNNLCSKYCHVLLDL